MNPLEEEYKNRFKNEQMSSDGFDAEGLWDNISEELKVEPSSEAKPIWWIFLSGAAMLVFLGLLIFKAWNPEQDENGNEVVLPSELIANSDIDPCADDEELVVLIEQSSNSTSSDKEHASETNFDQGQDKSVVINVSRSSPVLTTKDIEEVISSAVLAPKSTAEVISEVLVDSVSTAELVSEVLVDSVSTEEVVSGVSVDSVSTEEVISGVLVDSVSTAEVVSEVLVDSVSTEELVSGVSVDSVSTEEVISGVSVDSVSTEEVISGVSVDSVSTEEVISEVLVDSVSTEEVISEVLVDSVSTEEVIFEVLVDTMSTEEVISEVLVDTMSMEEVISEVSVDSVSMEEVISGVLVDSVSAEEVISEVLVDSVSVEEDVSTVSVDSVSGESFDAPPLELKDSASVTLDKEVSLVGEDQILAKSEAPELYLQLYSGINIMDTNYKGVGLDQLVDLKNQSERIFPSAQVCIKADLKLKNGLTTHLGLEYQRHRSIFEFEKEEPISVLLEDQLIKVFIDGITLDTLAKEFGSMLVDGLETRQVIHNNRYETLGIPIGVGYNKQIGNIVFGIEGGVYLGFTLDQNGKTLNASEQIVSFDDQSADRQLNDVMVGYRLAPSLAIQANSNLSLEIRPEINGFSSQQIGDSSVQSSPLVLKMNLAVKYQIK
jgi:hypothetical protein